jgi:glycosyltransferase involved in cell wall biosynthesis
MLSTDINFFLGERIEIATASKFQSKSFEFKMFKNIPREHVVGAFKAASVFVSPSQKEVAPVVLIEAQACKVPWISLDVGNVSVLDGGCVVYGAEEGTNGFRIYTNNVYQNFSETINSLLVDDNKRTVIGDTGRKQIEKEYDFSKIAKQYNEVFTSNDS